MNWTRSWRCLTKKLNKSTPEVSKISSSRYYHRVGFQERLILPRNPFSGFGSNSKHGSLIPSRHFGKNAGNDIHIGRDFLVQLWVADGKMNKKTRKVIYGRCGSPSPPPVYEDRLFSSEAYVPEFKQGKKAVSVPFPGLSEYLRPETPEEVQVEPLLARSNLLITRDIEWANLVLGFEQENRYAIVDVCYPQSFLRLRRPFVALVTDAEGNELFRVRRPFWWINSSIYAEVNGKEVGVVHRRWHLWRRIYDLYLGNKQFSVVENPGFWNWTFTLKDINGNVLAEIDRDWRGFGFELFTDAGQYVIRFGSTDPSSKHGAAEAVQDLEVFRPLSLSERAVAVALAISLDNDYFSRHGGWGLPLIAVGE